MKLSEVVQKLQMIIESQGDCQATITPVGQRTDKGNGYSVEVSKLQVELFIVSPGDDSNANPQ